MVNALDSALVALAAREEAMVAIRLQIQLEEVFLGLSAGATLLCWGHHTEDNLLFLVGKLVPELLSMRGQAFPAGGRQADLSITANEWSSGGRAGAAPAELPPGGAPARRPAKTCRAAPSAAREAAGELPLKHSSPQWEVAAKAWRRRLARVPWLSSRAQATARSWLRHPWHAM